MSFEVGLMRAEARGATVGACGAIVNGAGVLHIADAWVDLGENGERDGVVGCEIPFKRRSCRYERSRSLGEIDAELDVLSGEIAEMLRKVRA